MPILENQRNFSRKNFPRSRFGNISQQVIEWRKRAINAGSSHISMTTMKATDFLYKEMKKNGLLYKMKSVVGFCPCNLTAAITPIYYTHGNSTWQNFGFLESDLSVNGLFNNAVKYLKTGLNPSIIYKDDNSAGATVYVSQTSGYQNGVDIGCRTLYLFGGTGPVMSVTASSIPSWYCHNINTGFISGSTSELGYYSFNRTSSNSQTIHKFNSKINHSLLASGNGQPGNRPNLELYCFAENNFLDYSIVNFSATRNLSFAAVHEGLTEDESRIFSWIIQNYRIKLGGGFI